LRANANQNFELEIKLNTLRGFQTVKNTENLWQPAFYNHFNFGLCGFLSYVFSQKNGVQITNNT
jgi:hypothetical protein